MGEYQGSLTWQIFLQIKICLGIQGIIWLSQSSLTQHHQLVVLRRRRFIFICVHKITSHTTRVVTKSGFWDYVFYSNRSSIFIHLQGLDKYGIEHTDSRTNIQSNIGETCDQIRRYNKIYKELMIKQEQTRNI